MNNIDDLKEAQNGLFNLQKDLIPIEELIKELHKEIPSRLNNQILYFKREAASIAESQNFNMLSKKKDSNAHVIKQDYKDQIQLTERYLKKHLNNVFQQHINELEENYSKQLGSEQDSPQISSHKPPKLDLTPVQNMESSLRTKVVDEERNIDKIESKIAAYKQQLKFSSTNRQIQAMENEIKRQRQQIVELTTYLKKLELRNKKANEQLVQAASSPKTKVKKTTRFAPKVEEPDSVIEEIMAINEEWSDLKEQLFSDISQIENKFNMMDVDFQQMGSQLGLVKDKATKIQSKIQSDEATGQKIQDMIETVNKKLDDPTESDQIMDVTLDMLNYLDPISGELESISNTATNLYKTISSKY